MGMGKVLSRIADFFKYVKREPAPLPPVVEAQAEPVTEHFITALDCSLATGYNSVNWQLVDWEW